MYKVLMILFGIGNVVLYLTQDANKDFHLITVSFCLTMVALDSIENKLDEVLRKKNESE